VIEGVEHRVYYLNRKVEFVSLDDDNTGKLNSEGKCTEIISWDSEKLMDLGVKYLRLQVCMFSHGVRSKVPFTITINETVHDFAWDIGDPVGCLSSNSSTPCAELRIKLERKPEFACVLHDLHEPTVESFDLIKSERKFDISSAVVPSFLVRTPNKAFISDYTVVKFGNLPVNGQRSSVQLTTMEHSPGYIQLESARAYYLPDASPHMFERTHVTFTMDQFVNKSLFSQYRGKKYHAISERVNALNLPIGVKQIIEDFLQGTCVFVMVADSC
jgi:hypothetical protein